MGKNNDFDYLNKRINDLIDDVRERVSEIDLLKEYLGVELIDYKDRGNDYPFSMGRVRKLVKKTKKVKKDE